MVKPLMVKPNSWMVKHRKRIQALKEIQALEETKERLTALREKLIKARMDVAESLAAEVPLLTKTKAYTLIRFLRNPKWREVCEDWIEMMGEWIEDDKKEKVSGVSYAVLASCVKAEERRNALRDSEASPPKLQKSSSSNLEEYAQESKRSLSREFLFPWREPWFQIGEDEERRAREWLFKRSVTQ